MASSSPLARRLHIDLDHLAQRLAATPPALAPEEPRAAVAAVLRLRDEPEILFIRRAEVEGDPWSGHMAFPGGRRDPTDRDLAHTAMRETVEELGLDLGREGTPLGRLDDVPTHERGLVVSPFVYRVEGEPALIPNHEVAEVHWTPVAPLLRGERDIHLDLEYGGRTHRFPGFQVADRVVWGLTYRMLQILFDRLG